MHARLHTRTNPAGTLIVAICHHPDVLLSNTQTQTLIQANVHGTKQYLPYVAPALVLEILKPPPLNFG